MRSDLRVRQSKRLAARTIDGKGVVIVLDRQIVHTLNAVGMQVFDLADGRSTEEIVQALIQDFDVSEQQARSDVDTFVKELLSLGALEEVEQADPG